jgi:hypothetical protein
MSNVTTPAPRKSRLHATAVVLCSLVIAVPLFVGRLVEGILDTLNPAEVDTSQGLAYLSEILGLSFGALGVLLVVIVVLLAILYRRAKTLDAIALPLLVLAVQIVVGVVTLLLTGLADRG